MKEKTSDGEIYTGKQFPDEQTPLNSIVHTPGPWEFDESNFGVCSRHGYGLLDSLGETLGVTVHTTDVFGLPVEEAEANAKLIVAAPELLAALRRIRAELCRRHSPFVVETNYAYINEAIAKATK
jgi:O-acetyl-ADP-ribose deacetylase (regulator of RNase III)